MIPIVSDIDIYINGGLELEEVEVEIKAIDQEFVPTVQGKCINFAFDCFIENSNSNSNCMKT